jgi:hypothetical protein
MASTRGSGPRYKYLVNASQMSKKNIRDGGLRIQECGGWAHDEKCFRRCYENPHPRGYSSQS